MPDHCPQSLDLDKVLVARQQITDLANSLWAGQVPSEEWMFQEFREILSNLGVAWQHPDQPKADPLFLST